jgi:putative transposase
MKAKRFSEEQIIAVLKEAEAGAKTKDLCRKYGISDVTLTCPCLVRKDK